jgi:hypothetical protein
METTNKNLFQEWIDSIPVGEYQSVRDDVIKKCMITRQVFNHWKLGNSKVPPLAQMKINEIAGREIFKIEKPC